MILIVVALLGAGCCAGAAAMTWWTANFADSLAGRVTTSAKGSQVLPELVPVALLTLAGVGATFATRGWPRRVIGGLLVACGLLVAVRSALGMAAAPVSLRTDLARPAIPVGTPELHPVGPVLAVVGGVLIAIAGVLVILGAGRARGMGARYDAPSRRAARAASSTRAARSADDPAALWRALDAGADPTGAGEAESAGRPGAAPEAAPTVGPTVGPTDPVTDTHPGRIP
jgi:uncharacterized membrane protein (TIGR02234 family)